MDLHHVIAEHILVWESVCNCEGVADVAANPCFRPSVFLRPQVEDDGNPSLEEGLAAEMAPHGLFVAMHLYTVLLDEAKCGEGL